MQADGFHALDSIVVPLSLADEILLDRAESGEPRCARAESGERRAEVGSRSDETAFANEVATSVGASTDKDPSSLNGSQPDAPAHLRSPLSALRSYSETVDLGAMPEDVEKNLAMRALRLLEKEVGRALPTRIEIRKVIPLGGGLGGGSSNAATVLRGVNELWGLGLSTERLCELGAQLGSDVAQFVLDGLVRMRGRGEQVERLDASQMQPMWVVLANDGSHCSTPAVYRALDAVRQAQNAECGMRNAECTRASLERRAESGERRFAGASGEAPAIEEENLSVDASTEAVSLSATAVLSEREPTSALRSPLSALPSSMDEASPNAWRNSAFRIPHSEFYLTNGGEICDTLCLSLQKGEVEAVASVVANDLEVPCYGLFPEVARTAEALRAAGCTGVTLCGSGATVFGLVKSREEGEKALAHPALAGCWRACVQTLPDGVMAAHGPLTPIVMVRIHVGQP